MCGIAGIMAKRRIRAEALARMAGLQAHRGPDEENLWLDASGQVGFGHRRLSIIDLSPGGRQPMRHASGDVVVCYNGEIYNYLELAQRLREEGVVFSSHSDTEVLIEAYRAWGDRFLDELNGMFAFALYDTKRRRLLCARDRYGEKPFLYAATDDFFAFASEYKALLALAEIERKTDDQRLLRFLACGEGLDDQSTTVFPAIRQLLPGEYLTVDLSNLRVQVARYWTLKPDSGVANLGIGEAARHFGALLADSVRLRLRSDVPVGSCLSGGLDSGSIVCLARAQRGMDSIYHAFSGRFPGSSADEGPYIDMVAEVARVERHEVQPTPQALLKELGDFVWHNELPVSSGSQYAQWCVFRQARESGVVVLLDGQGGDELLGGYEQHFRAYVAEPGRSDAERAAIRQRYPLALAGFGEQVKTRLPHGLRRALARWAGVGSNITFGFTPEAARLLDRPLSVSDSAFTGLKALLSRESFQTVLPTLLRYGDRNSMAHSVEVRLPFCDHRLAEFVFGLRSEILMGDAQTKRLLREAMRGILPEGVRTRWNKQGFVPPQDQWMKGGLLNAVADTIEDAAFAARGYWNVVWWRKALARARSGEGQLAPPLWKAFIAEAWRRHFVDRIRDGAPISIFADQAV